MQALQHNSIYQTKPFDPLHPWKNKQIAQENFEANFIRNKYIAEKEQLEYSRSQRAIKMEKEAYRIRLNQKLRNRRELCKIKRIKVMSWLGLDLALIGALVLLVKLFF